METGYNVMIIAVYVINIIVMLAITNKYRTKFFQTLKYVNDMTRKERITFYCTFVLSFVLFMPFGRAVFYFIDYFNL
jgi:hypothetical protein